MKTKLKKKFIELLSELSIEVYEELGGGNFDEKDFQRLINDQGIIRHKGKIQATVSNAQRAIEIIDEKGSLASYLWSWEPDEETKEGESNRSLSATSEALSKDLKARGWSWVGPTTIYSFMQAVGMVNDHSRKCHTWGKIEDMRTKFIRP